MSYTLDQYVFRGLSTDTKPTVDPAGRGALPVGARFIEIDTGTQYDWDGSAWISALYDTGASGGGGGGGPVTVVDGGDVTQGAKANAAATDSTSSWSVISLLKGLYAKLSGTLAVSGTFWQTTQPVSAASLPLPTGASTSANQATGNTSLGSIDGKITACNTGAVAVSSSALPTGAATSAAQGTGNTSLASIDGKVTACNTGAVTVSSSALPSGGSTSALQTTGNTSLSNLDTKTPALGQAVAGSSTPVVLTAIQAASLAAPVVTQPDPAATTGTITAVDAGTTTTATLNGQSFLTGTATANSSVSATVTGHSSFSVEVTGTWAGTLAFEESDDGGTTWVSRGVYVTGTVVSTTTTTTNGLFQGNAAAATTIRVRCTAYTSGTATVRLQPGYGLGHARTATVVGGAASGAAVAGNPVLVSGSDGTNARSLKTDTSGSPILGAGTAIVGKVGIDQTTVGTTDSVTVKSAGYRSAPTVTRPANTTPYTAGDVVGGAITFTNAGPDGGHVLVTTADLRVDITALPVGMTTFRLYLYDATPPSALADNAAWDLPSGDRANFIGYLDLGTPADLGSTLYVQVTAPGLQIKLASGTTSIWGYLVTAGGFTPAANSEVYNPRIKAVGV